MDNREAILAKDKMVADIYARSYAAAVATNDNGVVAAVEAKLAVRNFITMMRSLNPSEWMYHKSEDVI